jgi:hypothetical protein
VATDAERVAALRQRKLKAGLTQVAVWIPRKRKANFLDAARRVRENPDLEVGTMRNVRTRLFVSLDSDKPKRKTGRTVKGQ